MSKMSELDRQRQEVEEVMTIQNRLNEMNAGIENE